MSKGDESAFPQEELRHADDGAIHRIGGGLTKREWMAGMAMQGLVGNPVPIPEDDTRRTIYGLYAYQAVAVADALLAELEKGESDGL